MIELWYVDAAAVSEQRFFELLETVPEQMREDILRFHFLEDRRLRLLARLCVQKKFSATGNFLWSQVKETAKGKPFIPGEQSFNISHSGDFVVVAFSNAEIGVDVEVIDDFDLTTMSGFFHPNEIDAVEQATNQLGKFYELWTRKEAFLKAMGIGITEELTTHNCLPDSIYAQQMWHLKSTPLMENYKLAICQNRPITEVKLTKIDASKFEEISC
jgi:4'-phosphopantetheinyl transferase